MTRFLIYTRAVVGALGAALAMACASTSLVDVPPTNNVTDPSVVTSPAGATQLYNYAISQWTNFAGGQVTTGPGFGATAGHSYVTMSGLMTDELMRVQNSLLDGFFAAATDERNDGSIPANDYRLNSIHFHNPGLSEMSRIRNSASQARQALEAYAPNSPPAWRARLQAAEAYMIVYLAELFCSGVPLSTTSLKGETVLTRGFSTEEMLARAITLFDSAVTLAGDSTRFKYLAAVGKGRALLQLGRFADAATAVSGVPTDFAYWFEFNFVNTTSSNTIGNRPQNLQVRDNEGTNGLVWSTDPRNAIVTTPSLSGAMPVPGKYSVTAGGTIDATVSNPSAPIRAADGLEARLIEAEAALATGNASWLTTLNTLRSTCIGSAACAPVPGLTPGNVPANLTDPGSVSARLDLLMKERAMWLYLTGHRQGDLRRLAHVYKRDPLTLWPTGLYVNPGFPPKIPPTLTNGIVSYLNVYVFYPRADEEQVRNPNYSGCNDLNP